MVLDERESCLLDAGGSKRLGLGHDVRVTCSCSRGECFSFFQIISVDFLRDTVSINLFSRRSFDRFSRCRAAGKPGSQSTRNVR